MMTPARLREITSRYRQLRVALLGDFCLDRYLEIDPGLEEISIETGLKVHNVVRVRAQPGGAGTVLNNLVALGVGSIRPIGWCGDDGEGYELRRELTRFPQVSLEGFEVVPSQRTFTYCKPLLIKTGEPPVELNRLDSKNYQQTPLKVQEQTVRSLLEIEDQVDAMILLDQVSIPETGVITKKVLEAIQQISERRRDLLIIGDSRQGLQGWPPISLKMNATELMRLTGRNQAPSIGEVQQETRALATNTNRNVIVTMAELGLIGADSGGEVVHQPALPVRGEIDIVGAGDSVTANLAAALSAKSSLAEALDLAALGSSIVIHKLGTTGTASPEEMIQLLEML